MRICDCMKKKIVLKNGINVYCNEIHINDTHYVLDGFLYVPKDKVSEINYIKNIKRYKKQV